MRIPYTGPLPPPVIVPKYADTPAGAVAALIRFLSAPTTRQLPKPFGSIKNQTVLLTGAGVSVASGLADYRGSAGTYTLNKMYRPIYYNEFITNHEARKRYWARSFMGWTSLHRARPNAAHWAIRDIDVDSFHSSAHPELPTVELHGYLRSLVCIQCKNHLPRDKFQQSLRDLNPEWADFLDEMLDAGALDTENPEERRKRGLRTNPDGDVDLPSAPYTTFRYPACPTCLADPPSLPNGSRARVEIDSDGAWSPRSGGGILKPAVIMFGESIAADIKTAAEDAIDSADRMLVVGSSLATYSAWRLVKKAKERNMPIGVINLGGIRGEEDLFTKDVVTGDGSLGVRCSESADKILPLVALGLAALKASDQ
ncbi:MAG: hypothetical protein LQ351_000404 [Letrouitia transgressa]|nr:MAG: hypothetical protein LQ351_000404 [Letrouitia transgressa]